MLLRNNMPVMSSMMLMGVGSSGPGGGGFDPMELAELAEWFDIRSLAGTPNGDQVGAWVGNKSLYTLSAAGAARGTYVTDGDGFPALQLDGVDDMPLCYPIDNHTLLGATGDYEIWCVVQADEVQTGSGYVWFISGQTNNSQLRAAAGASYLRTPEFSNLSVLPSIRDGAWKVIRVSKINTRRVVQINGLTVLDEITSAGVFNSGADFLALGNWDDALACSYRHFLTFTAPLSDEVAAALTTYLQNAL